MNFTNLKYFLAAAEYRSISRAAESLYTTQQNLSNHISRLEAELNVSLFERAPSLRLTYAGECVRSFAEQAVSLERQLSLQLDDIANQRKARLRIGVTRTRGRTLLSEVLPAFHRQYPEVELSVSLGRHAEMIPQLRRGELDLMVGMRADIAEHDNDIALENIYSTRLCLVVPVQTMRQCFPGYSEAELHAFEQSGIEDIHVFAREPFLLHGEGNVLRSICDRYFAACRFAPNVLLEINDLELLHRLSCSGMGITCSFEFYFQQWLASQEEGRREREAYLIPVNDAAFRSDFIIAYSGKHYLSNAARGFIDTALDAFAAKRAAADSV